MATDVQKHIRQVLKTMDDIRDNHVIRGKEYDQKFLLEINELIRVMNQQSSQISHLSLSLDMSRERGDDYMKQAIRNNEKYEKARSKISRLESGKEEDQFEIAAKEKQHLIEDMSEQEQCTTGCEECDNEDDEDDDDDWEDEDEDEDEDWDDSGWR